MHQSSHRVMRVFFLFILLISPICYAELNVDKLFATVGGRSASPYRSHVSRVIEQQATKLNVTAESHLDACKSKCVIIEKMDNYFKTRVRNMGKCLFMTRALSPVTEAREYVK